MKKMLLVLLFIASTATITLTYQWLDFSENHISESSSVKSTVTITATDEELRIEQSFGGYVPGSYKIDYPDEAEEIACAPAPCGEADNFQLKEESPVLSYRLPLSEQTSQWAAELEEEEVRYEVVVKDRAYENRSFTMVESPDAKVEKERLHYYKWDDVTSAPLFMYDTTDTQRFANDRLTILHERGELIEPAFVEKATGYTEKYGSYLLFLDEEQDTFTQNKVLLRNRNTEVLESLLFRKQTTENSGVRDHWVIRMYTALLFETSMERAEQLASPLSSTFSSEEKEEIKRKVKDVSEEDELVAFSDDLLSSMREGETTYSERIAEDGDSRFYYTVPRMSDTGGEFLFITYLNDTYIPLQALKEDQAFRITMLQNDSFLLETSSKRIRLSLGSDTFVQNEADFGIASEAVKRFEGGVYLKETFMNEVLDLYLGGPQGK